MSADPSGTAAEEGDGPRRRPSTPAHPARRVGAERCHADAITPSLHHRSSRRYRPINNSAVRCIPSRLRTPGAEGTVSVFRHTARHHRPVLQVAGGEQNIDIIISLGGVKSSAKSPQHMHAIIINRPTDPGCGVLTTEHRYFPCPSQRS